MGGVFSALPRVEKEGYLLLSGEGSLIPSPEMKSPWEPLAWYHSYRNRPFPEKFRLATAKVYYRKGIAIFSAAHPSWSATDLHPSFDGVIPRVKEVRCKMNTPGNEQWRKKVAKQIFLEFLKREPSQRAAH